MSQTVLRLPPASRWPCYAVTIRRRVSDGPVVRGLGYRPGPHIRRDGPDSTVAVALRLRLYPIARPSPTVHRHGPSHGPSGTARVAAALAQLPLQVPLPGPSRASHGHGPRCQKEMPVWKTGYNCSWTAQATSSTTVTSSRDLPA
eukprot:2034076-Rhodomonas_salina.1